MIIKLKIKSLENIKIFEKVNEVMIDNGFLLIQTKENKDTNRIEPIELCTIDYWKEIGVNKIRKK
jgi:hypothetical protein